MSALTDKGEAIYLIRHSKTALNTDGKSEDKIRGWKDIPLDAQGQRQSHAIADLIVSLEPAQIYTSDLNRAKVTASEAARKAKIGLEVDRAWRPWNLGDLQGHSAAAAVPVIKAHTETPTKSIPGGESFNDFSGRYIKAFKGLLGKHLSSGDTLVVVSHFRNLKLAEAWMKAGFDNPDIDIATFMRNDMPTGAILRIYRQAGKWRYEVLDNSARSQGVGVAKEAKAVAARVGVKRGVQASVPAAKLVGVRKLRAG